MLEITGLLCEGLCLRLEGMECPDQEGRMTFGLGREEELATWGSRGSLPAAHKACVWALLLLAEEPSAAP